MPGVSAVVLAAGMSSRMGGPNKMLMPWNGTTVVGAVVEALQQCNVEIVVVTGRDASDVAHAVKPTPTIFNAVFEQGMGTSIAAGVKACLPESAILIVLGDMPAIDPDVVRRLIENCTSPTDIVVPVYSDSPDRTGHPVLFGADCHAKLCSLDGDQGARSVVQSSGRQLRTIEIDGSLADIDAPADFAQ